MIGESSESQKANTSESPQETGWDRVKALFEPRYGTEVSEEIRHIPTVVGLGSVFGFIFGGRIGARLASDYHVRHNKLTIYNSQMQAQRELHSAVTLGFIKYGCKWGWRMGLFAGVYSCLLVVYSAYRNKSDALNYVASGASTGALYKLFAGWRGVVVGIVMGGGLSVPIGVLAQVGNTFLLPEEYKKDMKQKQEKIQEEWKKQMDATGNLISQMEGDLADTAQEGGNIN